MNRAEMIEDMIDVTTQADIRHLFVFLTLEAVTTTPMTRKAMNPKTLNSIGALAWVQTNVFAIPDNLNARKAKSQAICSEHRIMVTAFKAEVLALCCKLCYMANTPTPAQTEIFLFIN